MDENFINALFNGLSLVHEEDILNNIVFILIEINEKLGDSLDDNLFIKVHKTNNNARILNEILLRVLNNEENKDKTISIIKCLNNLMNTQEKSLFYMSDLESFIDILISKLQISNDEDLKVRLLESLKK